MIDIRIALSGVEGAELCEVWEDVERDAPVEGVVHDVSAPFLHLKLERVAHDALQLCHGPFRSADSLHERGEAQGEGVASI